MGRKHELEDRWEGFVAMGVDRFALLSRCFIQDNVFDKSGILVALFNA